MPCKNILSRWKMKKFPDCDVIRCRLLFTISQGHGMPEAFCNGIPRCEGYDDKVAKQVDPLDLAAPRLRKKALGIIATRCTSGELPRFQNRRPIDMKALFHTFVLATSKEAGKTLLRDMMVYQAKIDMAHGGLPLEVLATKFEDIAKAEGIEDALEEKSSVKSAIS